MKFIKRNEDAQFNNKLIAEISSSFNLSADIVKIIISKGYSTKEDIINFLQPYKFKYHNPFLLTGISDAVETIKNAISLNKKITVVGDYDTDGICATAILYKYFESVNVKIDYFLPNRFVDGYGLSNDTINKIISLYNPNLIITVDCGISSYSEVEYAKSLGIEVIVTDHHEIPETIPNCIVINPKLKNQDYPFNDLCGAGVALKLVQALNAQFANNLTSIAAFATVADIVPLLNENRAIVYNGLKDYKNTLPKGLIKLMESFKIPKLQASDISLKLAPKINAAGRMGDANVAFKLFIENDDKKIAKIIDEIKQLNDERVSDGADIFEQAVKMLDSKNISELRAIVLYDQNWNSGVLGIVCAKLVEKFNRPVCLLSRSEGEFKGSIRSIEKIDIYKELSSLSHLLIRFGGHSQAGGLSIAEKNLELFSQQLNNNLKNNYSDSVFEQLRYYDLDLNKINLTSEFLQQLEMLEPFGFSNDRPVFKITFNNAKIARMKNYNNHLKIKFNNLDIVAWNMGHSFEQLKTNSNKEILIELGTEYEFHKVRYVNAVLRALKISKLNTNIKNDIVNANYIKQLEYLNQPTTQNAIIISPKNTDEIINQTLNTSLFGTLVITSNFNNYTKFVNKYEKFISTYELTNINVKTAENTILFMPNYAQNISGYKNIIFLESLITHNVLNKITNANIYVVNCDCNIIKWQESIDANRSIFAQYHHAIANLVKNDIFAESEYEYFLKLSKLNPQLKNIKYDQFIFVTLVLQELGIINVVNQDLYAITINNNVKNKLENSVIFNSIKAQRSVRCNATAK